MDAQSANQDEARPGILRQLWDKLEQAIEADRRKLGGMTLDASARLGLAELREAFSLGGNIEQPTPLGMYGTRTPGEIGDARDKTGNVWQMTDEPRQSAGGDHAVDQSSQQPVQDQDHDRGRGRGR